MEQNEHIFKDENEHLTKLIETIAKDIQRYCGKYLLFDDARYFMAIVDASQSMTKDQLSLSEGKSGLFILNIAEVNRRKIEKIFFCNLTYMLAFHYTEILEGVWENLEDCFVDITNIDVDNAKAFKVNRTKSTFDIVENSKELRMDLDIIANDINGALLPGFDYVDTFKKAIEKRTAFLEENPESYKIFTT